jgi:hypothetical protein
MTLTPEMIALIANIFALLGGFLRLESRLTKLETHNDLLMKSFVERKRKEDLE